MALNLNTLLTLCTILIVKRTVGADVTVDLIMPYSQEGSSCYRGFLAHYDTILLQGYIIYKDIEYWGSEIQLITLFMKDRDIIKDEINHELTLKDCLNKTSWKIQCQRTANANVFKVQMKLKFTKTKYEVKCKLNVATGRGVFSSNIIHLTEIYDPLNNNALMHFNGKILPVKNCKIYISNATANEMCCDEHAPSPTKASVYFDGVEMTGNERCMPFNYQHALKASKNVGFSCDFCNSTAVMNWTCSVEADAVVSILLDEYNGMDMESTSESPLLQNYKSLILTGRLSYRYFSLQNTILKLFLTKDDSKVKRHEISEVSYFYCINTSNSLFRCTTISPELIFLTINLRQLGTTLSETKVKVAITNGEKQFESNTIILPKYQDEARVSGVKDEHCYVQQVYYTNTNVIVIAFLLVIPIILQLIPYKEKILCFMKRHCVRKEKESINRDQIDYIACSTLEPNEPTDDGDKKPEEPNEPVDDVDKKPEEPNEPIDDGDKKPAEVSIPIEEIYSQGETNEIRSNVHMRDSNVAGKDLKQDERTKAHRGTGPLSLPIPKERRRNEMPESKF